MEVDRMIKYEHIKADYKQILREPIMVFLFLLPVLLIGVFKAMIIFLPEYILTYLGIHIMDYSPYIMAVAFLQIPGMLGTVTGFMMLDDKDGKIYELMSVTPLGRDGYLYNRLFVPIMMTILYSLITWIVIDITPIPFNLLALIWLLLSIQTAIIGLVLFHIADDKVKGLTYAKGLNIIMLFGLADLLNIDAVKYVAKIFPTYWVTKVIKEQSINTIILALCIHLLWLVIILGRFYKSKN